MDHENPIQLPSNEKLLASAVQFLVQGEDDEAASILLACELDVQFTGNADHWTGIAIYDLRAVVAGPRPAYDILTGDRDHPVRKAMETAIRAVTPDRTYVSDIVPRAALIDIGPDWRSEMVDIVRGKSIHNQGNIIQGKPVHLWQHLRFRSPPEIRIAEALDAIEGVVFFPNCMGRLMGDDGWRVNREPDFLVCYRGKWGILEIDGMAYHASAAKDHDRDRLFRSQGIKVVEHFDATESYETPKSVVDKFLKILMHS